MSSEDDQQGCVGRFMSGFTSNLSAFGKFLYNSEDGTVMGRDGGSWLRISIFYLGYYMFLAALFAISITATLSALDPYKPYFQTRLQYPGVTILPRTDKFDPAALDIKYNDGDNRTYEAYVNGITELLEPYDATNQTEADGFVECNVNTLKNQKFDEATKANACKFEKKEFFKDCTISPYGYPSNPCIFVKLNRVINWKPVPFMSLTDELAMSTESGAISLAEHLTQTGKTYNKDFTYVVCSGKRDEDKKNLGDPEYKPEGISAKYFPYFGKQRTNNYVSPMVSVRFPKITRNVEIKATCKVYARNMIDLARINVGYVDFKVNIENGTIKTTT